MLQSLATTGTAASSQKALKRPSHCLAGAVCPTVWEVRVSAAPTLPASLAPPSSQCPSIWSPAWPGFSFSLFLPPGLTGSERRQRIASTDSFYPRCWVRGGCCHFELLTVSQSQAGR